MNVENIKRVRDHIASLPPERFDMTVYGGHVTEDGDVVEDLRADVSDCGTVACICGWTVAIFGVGEGLDDQSAACEVLGLTEMQGDLLFIPDPRNGRTSADAARVLDHLIATGEVDWSVAAGAE